MKRSDIRAAVYSLLGALAVTVLLGWGILLRPDKWTQDKLFQSGGVSSGQIVIIGIDEKALAEIGPYNTWDRNVMASALRALASDPVKRPAVVAIDTLYVSTSNEEADNALADAAAELGNVITATTAELGRSQSFENGEFVTEEFAVLNYEEPYERLRSITTQGHINAMYDIDGVMRHALLYVDTDQGRVYSMAYEAADAYNRSRNEETVLPEVNARGFFYLPFSSVPGGYYDGASISDLINGDIDPDYYAGKIVLIGPYTPGLQDSYFTPVDSAVQMYGVEIQANAIQCIIEQNYKSEVAAFPQLALVFLISAAAFFVFLKNKVGISTVICIVTAGAGIFVPILLYNAGYVTHPLWLPAGVGSLYIVSVIVHYVRAAVERQKVTRTFERYVAPNIVSEILKEGTDNLSLGGKLCDIAVLFVDIRGFTTMSERMSPEEVVFILNKYLTMTSGCIEKNQGTLDKFVGDATMAFWGAPLPQEDPVYLACRTALDIVNGAAELSKQLKEEIDEELRVGVGVHYGPAVVGNMGSEKHMDYTAIGDTVNTSARLEANAPGGTVYISRKVADELKGRGTFTSLGDTVKLKGKAEGFEVLRLESLEEKDA